MSRTSWAKVPSLPNPEQRYTKWKDLSPPAVMFSYSSLGDDQYRIFSRHTYMAGFRYTSLIWPLVPENPRGLFIYVFNPHRETPGLLPSAVPGDPDPKAAYLKSASEIEREVIGGLSCWRMGFDLPTAEEDLKNYHVSLTDGGTYLRCAIWCPAPPIVLCLYMLFGWLSGTGEGSITASSML